MKKLLPLLFLTGCASIEAEVPNENYTPTVTSTYVVMNPKQPSVVVLKTDNGFIELGAGDVFTCKEKNNYTICQVFGEPL
jgi:PBP1b-binding outer membrane lipoprotein LpoB